MNVETVQVGLGDRSYDIRIGPGLIAAAGAAIRPLLRRQRLAVITDETVAHLHLPALTEALDAAGIETLPIVAPPGEGSKSLTAYGRAMTALLDHRMGRDDVIAALGGGVIGDLAGFAAATLLRGVDFVQIPTTLLAQVDSSVGGKTGVNAEAGKNLIGAFHQPRLVLADIDALQTLPKREFLSGYAEVAKYGLLGDADFFAWLEAEGPAMAARTGAALTRAIRRSCKMKAAIVARDEREAGDRALLNLGHTFGHALEAATGYSDRLLHGEAVAIGIGLAFETSARMGLCAPETPNRVRGHFRAMGMPAALADIPGDLPGAEDLIRLMGSDKKARDGRIVFVLARGIGDAFVARDADIGVAKNVLEDALAERRGAMQTERRADL